MGADFIFAVAEITEPENTWLAKVDSNIQLFMDNYDFMDRWGDLDDELETAVISELKDAINTCYHHEGHEMGRFSPDGITTYVLTGERLGEKFSRAGASPIDIYDHIDLFSDFQTIVERGT